MEIAVSYLKSKLSKSETINKIDESKADLIHVDLMDGIYAGVCNFTMKTVIDDLKYTNKPLDIHLMTINPEVYINDLAKLNIDTITFHFDATDNIEKTINLIKKYNLKDITFHGLRHTSVSLQIASGIQMQIISKRAGHSNISITHNIYSHFFDSEFKEVANKMDNFLNTKTI